MLLPPYCLISDVADGTSRKDGITWKLGSSFYHSLVLMYFPFGRVACNKIIEYQCLKEKQLKFC